MYDTKCWLEVEVEVEGGGGVDKVLERGIII